MAEESGESVVDHRYQYSCWTSDVALWAFSNVGLARGCHVGNLESQLPLNKVLILISG